MLCYILMKRFPSAPGFLRPNSNLERSHNRVYYASINNCFDGEETISEIYPLYF